MTTYAYIRVSTDKQDLNNQRHGVIEYAKKHNLEPLTFFEDTASGRKLWRERDFGKLLEQAKKGDVIIVSEVSRLARSTFQVLEILQEAAKKEIAVHIAKNNMIMDGSLNARITATVLGLAAEIEREFISMRTTEALAKRKAEGKPLGRPKGVLNPVKKLDKHKKDIKAWLDKGVHKTSIARMLDCSPNTLYLWLEDNGFGEHVKKKNRD